MDKSYRRFYEEVGEKYPEESVVYSTLRGILRKQFIINRLAGMHGVLLDAGCNVGTYCLKYQNGKVIGVDIAHSVLVKAKQRVPEGLFVVGDLECLRFIKDGKVRNVLCTEVLEHLQNPEAALQEFYRILTPEGKLLITTPNYKKRPTNLVQLGILKSFGVQAPEGDKYLHTAFKPNELSRMLLETGFEVIEKGTLEKPVKYCAKFPRLLFLIINLVNRSFVHSERFSFWGEKIFNLLSLRIYESVEFLGLQRFLDRWVKEGVRSYAVARKPKEACADEEFFDLTTGEERSKF